jgi:hypothetical protein
MDIHFQPSAKPDMNALQASESDIKQCFDSVGSEPYLKFPHGLGPDVPEWHWFIGNNYFFRKFKIIFSVGGGAAFVWRIFAPTPRDFSKYKNWTGL